MIEVDRETDLETIVGQESRLLAVVLDGNLALDADEFFRGCLFGDASRLNQEHERAGAAIHDRYFRRAELDIGVIDAQPGKGRHQVLDRTDFGTAVGQRRAEVRVGHAGGVRRNLDDRIKIGTHEDDARVGRRGT
ncbi:hypothetical protein GCM10009038_32180 [Salinicola rhizosphaerae]|uniref:Uncharacterized protein n=1 Tax=Salinicola rhizosphaerae TaxID=1443141 RepID=A0ABQ3EDU7_9GAMM|nr:hypothetical protein GCM10009038_32180 [Salinicola rhizosphaerae]